MSTNPAEQTAWSLLSFRLDPDSAEPELFGVIHEGSDWDRPLMSNGRIVFFRDRGRAPELIRQYGSDLHADLVDVEERVYHCDVAQTLFVLSSISYDATAVVVTTLNALLDLVRATRITLVDERRLALYSIANFATTSRDIPRYFADSAYSNRQLVDAVLWCVGAVVAKSRIV